MPDQRHPLEPEQCKSEQGNPRKTDPVANLTVKEDSGGKRKGSASLLFPPSPRQSAIDRADVNVDPTNRNRTRIAAKSSGDSKCLGMSRTVALAQ